MTKCRACPATFPDKPRKQFCSDACRNRFNGLARAWALKLLDQGMLTLETLEAAQQPCTGSEDRAA